MFPSICLYTYMHTDTQRPFSSLQSPYAYVRNMGILGLALFLNTPLCSTHRFHGSASLWFVFRML